MRREAPTAEVAIREADVSEAAQYAPLELRPAREKLGIDALQSEANRPRDDR